MDSRRKVIWIQVMGIVLITAICALILLLPRTEIYEKILYAIADFLGTDNLGG